MKRIDDAGIKRIATKTSQQDFDPDLWVEDMFEEIVSRVSSEVPDGDQVEVYNYLARMLRIDE